MTMAADAIPREVLASYGVDPVKIDRIDSGLINTTWLVADASGRCLIVQRLHPIFDADNNRRMALITERLASLGQTTPRLVGTSSGENHLTSNGHMWRVQTYIPGVCVERLSSAAQARAAGELLARFHSAFSNWNGEQELPSASVHDPSRRLEELRAALNIFPHHRNFGSIRVLADPIFAHALVLPRVRVDVPRVVHGDPKISNFIFDEHGRGRCLVDFDTVGFMPLAWELGDAFRSWCNRAGEDTDNTAFSLELFAAALDGYAAVAKGFLTPIEISSIVPATETIYTELAARFCADALRETHFGWDPSSFPSRSKHNMVRALGQLQAAKDLATKRESAEQIVAQVFE